MQKFTPVLLSFIAFPMVTLSGFAKDAEQAPKAPSMQSVPQTQDAPQIRISTNDMRVAAGRTALISATVTRAGKALKGALLVPYVNGVRFGDPIVSDEKGRAQTYLPLFDTIMARVQFDIVQKDEKGKWILSNPQSPSDRWIWADETRDNQNVWLQKTFDLPQKPAKATLRIAADDAGEVFVNGQSAGKIIGWKDDKSFDVAPLLGAGRNVISVAAHNGSGAASFALRMDAGEITIGSDASWKFWNAAPANWPRESAGGAAVRVLGTINGYITQPTNWPGLSLANAKIYDKLAPEGALEPSATVSNALDIAVAPPQADKKVVARDIFSDTWVGTDGLGRALPTFEDVGAPRPNKSVGIFYYIWQSHHSLTALRLQQPVFNSTEVLLANPNKPNLARATNWWAEPIFGYYNASDRWVLRKQTQMLSDAGIDTLVYDTSNRAYYWPEWLNQADLLQTLRDNGQATPDIAHLFWASTDDPKGLPDVSRRFYDAGLYRDLWFNWKGKPLLLADATKVTDALAAKYSLRTSWAWTNPKDWFGDGHDKWPWLAETPQDYGWHESPDKPEQLAVSAGHHASSNKGRSMLNAVQPDKANQHPELGLQFAEQWKRVPEVDPEFLFITQWNEWVAGAYAAEDGQVFDGRVLTKDDSYMIDEYNSEFSRDIEPTRWGTEKAGLSDNY